MPKIDDVITKLEEQAKKGTGETAAATPEEELSGCWPTSRAVCERMLAMQIEVYEGTSASTRW